MVRNALRPKRVTLDDNIILLIYPTDYALTSSLLRPQEFWDSRKFRGKVGFTLEEYMDWYATQKSNKGVFDYFTHVVGMNVPSKALIPFFEGDFDPLSDKEKVSLDLVKNHFLNGDRFSLIGISQSGERRSLIHEIAHGLYHTDLTYKKKVLQVISKIHSQDRESINNFLKNQGYHRATYWDETHAYVLADLQVLRSYGVKTKRFEEANRELRRIFHDFSTIDEESIPLFE